MAMTWCVRLSHGSYLMARTRTHTQKLCENEEKLSKQLMHMIRCQNIYNSRAPGCGQPTLFFHFPIQFECVEAVKWYENKRSAYVVSTIKVRREPTLRMVCGVAENSTHECVWCGVWKPCCLVVSHGLTCSFSSFWFASGFMIVCRLICRRSDVAHPMERHAIDMRVDWKLFVFRTSTIATSCD